MQNLSTIRKSSSKFKQKEKPQFNINILSNNKLCNLLPWVVAEAQGITGLKNGFEFKNDTQGFVDLKLDGPNTYKLQLRRDCQQSKIEEVPCMF